MKKIVSDILISAIASVIGSPPAAGKHSLEISSNKPESSTFSLGDVVKLKFTASGLKPYEIYSVQFELRDDKNNQVTGKRLVLIADRDGIARAEYIAPSKKMGYYAVTARLPDGTEIASLGTRPAGIFSYAVVPNPAKRVDYGAKMSHFGMQGGLNSKVNVLPYLGIRYYLYGNDWAALEPNEPGQFSRDQSRFESKVRGNLAYPSGLMAVTWGGKPWAMYPLAVVMRASMPPWAMASTTGGKHCPKFGVLNRDGKRELSLFAAAQAQEFAFSNATTKPRIYQVTWEPADWCFSGTPAQLVEMYASVYGAIHDADPAALIAGPTLFTDQKSSKQIEDLLRFGMGQYIDVLSVHPYAEFAPETHDFVKIIHDQLAAVRKAAGHPVGLIGTEHGFKSTDLGDLRKAQGDVRTTLMMLGENAMLDFGFYIADFSINKDGAKVAETYGFYWNLNQHIPFGTDKVAPKIIVPAYAAMTWLLDGATSVGALTTLKGTQLGYQFRKDGRYIDVIWDYGGTSVFKIKDYKQVCDWMGNCDKPPALKQLKVGGSPIYLLN